jgi:anion-transporting  ArsA/GET3 family ATPase
MVLRLALYGSFPKHVYMLQKVSYSAHFSISSNYQGLTLFYYYCRLVQTIGYSIVVFDTAPTGHTLQLLQFPSTLEKSLEEMMDLKKDLVV